MYNQTWHLKMCNTITNSLMEWTCAWHYRFILRFNWDKEVVTIRQHKPLSKVEKWWTSKVMCIEGWMISLLYQYTCVSYDTNLHFTDPFDLSHNLASAVTGKSESISVTTTLSGRNCIMHPLMHKYAFCIQNYNCTFSWNCSEIIYLQQISVCSYLPLSESSVV